MLNVFGIVVSANVLFVAWRVWVARYHPRDDAPRTPADATAPAPHVATTR